MTMNLTEIAEAIDSTQCGALPESLANRLFINTLYNIANSLENPGDVDGDLVPAELVAFGAIASAYPGVASFNTTLQEMRLIVLNNDTDVGAWISDDGAADSIYLRPKEIVTLDVATNGRRLSKALFLRYDGVVAPTEGNVIFSGVK